MFHYGHDMKPGDRPRLRKLEIERQTRVGAPNGGYKGQITFDTPTGTIDLNLSEEQCAAMFAVVADGVIDTAKQVAGMLTEELKASLATSAPLVIK